VTLTATRTFHVGLNAQLLSGHHSYRAAGIHRYIGGLLDHLPAADSRFTYTAFTGPSAPILDAALHAERTSLPTTKPLGRIAWEQFVQPIAARQSRLDLFHVTAYVSPIVATVPTVVTVHDLSFLRSPDSFRFANRTYLSLFTGLSCQRARRVIAVSEYTKKDVMKVYGLPADKIDVVYSGLDPEIVRPPESELIAFRKRHGLPDKFILYLGTIEPRKNLSTLIRAYAKVRPAGVKLVCAGGRGWMYEDVFQTVEELRLSREVIFPGFLPGDDLPFWYSAAQVFVYPSTYEGFGLPVIEAMACGVPTITTNSSSLPEAAGDAAILVPPDDSSALAEALARLLADDSLQVELAERGLRQAARFTWEDAATNTACVYAKALGLPEIE
jgi:glycosyltransferase involved in cell wall biosynthesis